MIEIINKKELVANSRSSRDREARQLALDSLEAALKAVDPKQIIKSKVKLKGAILNINTYSFNLKNFSNIFVVGGGKASGLMAEALEEILGDYITEGAINVPSTSTQPKTQKIKLQKASHPIPDEAGMTGTRKMLDVVSQADEDDLVICLISGGGSSLMPLPRGEVSLRDKQEVTRALLKSGATINEINAVRKHISEVKGGWLAKKAYPATVVNLLLSDVVGDPLDVIASGPTVPDSTTFSDAIHVLKKYRLWEKISASIRKLLLEGEEGRIPETPKADDPAFKKVYNIVVGNNYTASMAAYSKLQNEGVNTLFLTSYLEGEARHVGKMFAAMICEIATSGKPIPKPAGIVTGGETTVTVSGNGIGGRNQEICLGAALKINHMDGAVVASISTDGVDGPTDAAGAIADGKTVLHAQKLNLNAEQFLLDNDSYTFFSKLNDLIFTGPTGTNVNDVSVIVVV